MTVFLAIGNRLEERQIADVLLVLSSPHLPFYTVLTSSIMACLYSNKVKFAYGFEYSLIRDGGRVISPESSQIVLMFLACLGVKYRAFPLTMQSVLWIDIGEVNKVQEPREGMELTNTMETSGYGFFEPDKVCWGACKFHTHLTNKILFGVWQLQNSYSLSYQKVTNAYTFDGHCYELFGFLGKQFSTDPHDHRTYKALQIILKWVVENLVWEFQKEALAVC